MIALWLAHNAFGASCRFGPQATAKERADQRWPCGAVDRVSKRSKPLLIITKNAIAAASGPDSADRAPVEAADRTRDPDMVHIANAFDDLLVQ
jgi:hypothetical protein